MKYKEVPFADYVGTLENKDIHIARAKVHATFLPMVLIVSGEKIEDFHVVLLEDLINLKGVDPEYLLKVRSLIFSTGHFEWKKGA